VSQKRPSLLKNSFKKLISKKERMKFLLFLMEEERLREETAADTNEGGINYQ
jgi:hypothetical protein